MAQSVALLPHSSKSPNLCVCVCMCALGLHKSKRAFGVKALLNRCADHFAVATPKYMLILKIIIAVCREADICICCNGKIINLYSDKIRCGLASNQKFVQTIWKALF